MKLIQIDSHIANTPCVGKSKLFESTNVSDAREAVKICLEQCPRLVECRTQRDPAYQGTWAGELWVRNTKYDTRAGELTRPRTRRRGIDTEVIPLWVLRPLAEVSGLDLDQFRLHDKVTPEQVHPFGMFLAALQLEGYSVKQIAKAIGRSRSGVQRAIREVADRQGSQAS